MKYKSYSIRRITVVLLITLMLTASTGFMRQGQGAGFDLSISIDKINIDVLTVHLGGRALGIDFPGQLDQYQVQVDWGDGNIDYDSKCSFTLKDLDNDGRMDDFEGCWVSEPDHTYEKGGNYIITAKLYHQRPPGAESGLAQMQLTIHILEADIAIQKIGPSHAHVGETITYIYNVNNGGPDGATGVTVIDDKAGNARYVSGDTNGNGYLDVGENWIFNASYTVSSADPDPLSSAATVRSNIADPDMSNNEASWIVDILHPAIAIDKYADETLTHEGDTVHYIYNVTNVGDCPLYNVSVTDSLGIAVTYYDEFGDGDWVLEEGEWWRFKANYTVPDRRDKVYNIGTAHGFDALGMEVTGIDLWSIDVLHPNIMVTKTANATEAYAGDIIEYTVKVTNIGDCMLYNVNVTDYLLGALLTNGNLGVNENFTCTYAVTTEDLDLLVNTVAASGKDALGLVVSDEDSAKVSVVTNVAFYVSGMNSDASGILLTVDGVGYTYADLPKIFTWPVGSSHSFEWVSPVSAGSGKRYEWKSTGGLSTSRSGTITVPSEGGSIQATYDVEYELVIGVSPSEAGSTNPGAGSHWFDSGSSVQVQAVPNAGYVFSEWQLDDAYYSVSNPVTVTMDAQHMLTAVFSGASCTLIVQVCQDGTSTGIPGVTVIIDGSHYQTDSSGTVSIKVAYGSHAVEINTPHYPSSDTRYVFTQWSDGPASNSRVINVSSNTTLTAYMKRQYKLAVNVNPPEGGSVSESPSSTDGFYDEGINITLTSSSNLDYAFDSWTGDVSETGSSASVIMDAPKSVTANFFTFTISIDPSSGSTSAGGSVSATVTVTYGSGVNSKIISFSSSGEPSGATPSFSPGSVTISSSSTTATSIMTMATSVSTPTGTCTITVAGSGGGLSKSTQYILAVTTSSYTVSFQILDDSDVAVSGATINFDGGNRSHGDSATVAAGSYPLSTCTIPKGYRFLRWETGGGVSVASQTETSTTASVSGDSSITMRLQRITTVSFVALIGFDASGIILTVDGEDYYHTQLPLEFTWEVGSTHSFTWADPVSGDDGVRYEWVSTSGLSSFRTGTITVPSGGGSVAATYKTQYRLTIDISPSGAGATNPTPGQHWFDSGSSVQVSASPSAGYAFSSWLLDGSTCTENPLTFIIISPRSLRAYFRSSTPPPPSTATVTFFASGMSPDASGAILTVDGVGYTYSNLPKSFTWNVGSLHSFSWSNLISAGSGKRYAWVSTSGLSAAKSGYITVPAEGGWVNATYKTQYCLTVTSPYDAPSGEGWYDAGDEAYASLADGIVNLTSGMRAVFAGWSGDASGNGLVSNPIMMDAPKTAVANWVIQWFIDVEVTPEEAGSIPGEGWYNNCTTVTFEAPEYLPSEEGIDGTRYSFHYWEIDGERFDGNVISVHANKSHIITPIYIIQYMVIFNQAGLDQSANEIVVTVNGSAKKLEDLPFALWVDYGLLINYTYRDVISSNISGKRFKLENILGPSSPVTAVGPANITGNYQTLYYLLVVSDYGGPRGSGWYPFNSEARFSVTTPVDHGNRTLRVFLRWHGDVNIFEPEGTILMNKSSVVIASWETQYLVTFNTTLPNKYILRVPGVPETLPPSMDVFGMYYPEGERITVGPAPAIVPDVEGVRYALAGWTLDGEIFTYDVNMSLVVKKPHDVAVLYETEYLLSVSAIGVSDPFAATVTISSSASVANKLTPASSIQEWFRQGTNLALTASTPNMIGHGYWAIFKEWMGDLQVANRTILFTMLSPRNLNAVFFKVNPVAESIPYSIAAGLISMLLCVISARRRVSEGEKRRSATSGIIVSTVTLMVAAIVSVIIATGYGININELLDFTNWAVIFLISEAIIFALLTAAIVRKD